MDPLALIVGEKEGLVLADRSANGAAELIHLERRLDSVEEAAGIEIAVAEELESRPVELIRAGPGNYVYDRATRGVFRIRVAHLDLGFADTLHVREHFDRANDL